MFILLIKCLIMYSILINFDLIIKTLHIKTLAVYTTRKKASLNSVKGVFVVLVVWWNRKEKT